jgi:hypothetical protein
LLAASVFQLKGDLLYCALLTQEFHMKKFLVLYRMDMAAMHEMMKTMTKEEQQKDMAEWKKWMEDNATHFADAGAPVGKNWQVTAVGASQVSNDVGGYAIVQAKSAEEAAQIMSSGPHLKMPGSTCDVMEIVSM